MKLFFRLLVVLLSLASGATALAQTETLLQETVKLEHKPAGDIIPLIKPLLPEHAVIRGEGYKMMLKTTAENMPQVKQLIADLDKPLQQLQISVALSPVVLQQETTVPSSTTTSPNQQSTTTPAITTSGTTRIYKTRGQHVTGEIQVVQMLQDRWSMIRTGQAIPVTKRTRNADGTVTESISYQQINQGLRIRPQLLGEEVILSIQPFYEAASESGSGQEIYYKSQQQTKAWLGTWISIDATTGRRAELDDNTSPQSSTSPSTTSLIYLKVDITP
jgi:hypothetical protein